MPINFKLTFTQPIFALVQAGGVSGPEGWAKAITSHYSSTVQKGLPIGVPPVLPAPGLAVPPAFIPPPFNIGASGITKSAAKAREKNMYNVLYLYYFAKLQAVDKANIEGLIRTVKDLYARLNTKQKEIVKTIKDIKAVKQELQNIGPTIELIKRELGDEIEYQKDQIKGLLKTIDDFKIKIEAGNFGSTYGKTGEQVISELFSKEKEIIDLVKNGNLLSLNTILKLANLIQNYVNDKSTIGAQLGAAMKKEYVVRYTKVEVPDAAKEYGVFETEERALQEMAKELFKTYQVSIAENKDSIYMSITPRTPTNNFAGIKTMIKSIITDMVQNLINLGKSIMELALYFKPEALSKLVKDMLGRRPALKKVYDLITKFDLFIRYIKPKLKKLQYKKDKLIKEIQTQIQVKIDQCKEFVQKKIKQLGEKIENGHIVKFLKKQKESFELWQKDHKEQINKWKKNIQLSLELAKRLDTIQKAKERLNDKWNDFANDKEKGLEARIKKYQKTIIEAYERTQEQIKQQFNEASAIDDPKLDFSNMSIGKLRTELKKLSDYYNAIGLKTPLLKGIGPIIMKKAKLDFEVFQKLFEAEVKSLGLMAKEACVIYLEVKEVRRIWRDFKQNNRSKKSRKKVPNAASYADNPTKLERLLDYIFSVDVDKLKAELKAYKEKQKEKIEIRIKAFGEEVEIMLLNLIPVHVEVADKKDKKAKAAAKKQRALEIIDEATYYYQLGKEVFKMTDSGLGLLQNLSTKQVLPSQNETLFNTFLDSYYQYQKINFKRGHKQPTEANSGLIVSYNRAKTKEKARIKKEFNVMVLVEMLVKGVKELLKEVKETDFGKELKQMYDESSEEIKQNTKSIVTFLTNPTDDIPTILDIISKLDLKFLTHPGFMDKLRALEKKHLTKTRELLSIMLNITGRGEEVSGAAGTTLSSGLVLASRTPISGSTASGSAASGSAFRGGATATGSANTIIGNAFNKTAPRISNAVANISYVLLKNDYFIDIIFNLIKDLYEKFVLFMKKFIKKILKKVTQRLDERKEKAKEKKIAEQKTEAKKKINIDAPILQAVLTLAIRAYWTGASWYGPTNSKHIVTKVGSFRPKIQALPINGLPGIVKEMELGFTNQMKGIKGIIIPPAETGISPLSFSQYV